MLDNPVPCLFCIDRYRTVDPREAEMSETEHGVVKVHADDPGLSWFRRHDQLRQPQQQQRRHTERHRVHQQHASGAHELQEPGGEQRPDDVRAVGSEAQHRVRLWEVLLRDQARHGGP